MNIHQKDVFFSHAITILSLFTYSVCDEKVKIVKKTRLKVQYRRSTGCQTAPVLRRYSPSTDAVLSSQVSVVTTDTVLRQL